MLTFLQFKNLVRSRVFPAGESRNLRPSHDKSMVDALVDLQRWVDCIQNNNTFLAPHCATFFNCGLTSFDFPRGRIKRLSVVDKATSSSTSSSSSGSSDSSSSSNSVIAAGTVVATVNDSQPIFAAAKVNLTLYEVDAAQSFTIAVTQGGQNCGNYTSVKPQYVRTTVTYTDPDGISQTIQVGPECHLNDCNIQASITVAVKASTVISYSLTPFNSPFTDGGVNVGFIVTAASSGAAVSTPGNTTSGADTTVVTSGGDWCDEIQYEQVEACQIHAYLEASRRRGCCANFTPFFAIPSSLSGGKNPRNIPTPTDAGVDPALPPLQLGYHYPQESTNSSYGRSLYGRWAVENGRIYIAPWIESTETVVVKWEGIKRDWADADPVDDDPGLLRAVELYLRWEHARDWDSDLQKAQAYEMGYRQALADLIYDCEEENRVRSCEPNHARGIAPPDVDAGVTPDSGGTPPVTPTGPTVYYNDRDFVGFAPCSSLQEAGAPMPTGPGATITVKIGTVPGSSLAAANALAQETADALAAQQLGGKCTFWNKAQSWTAKCTLPDIGQSTETEPASTHSSKTSQAEANNLALQQAKNDANASLVCISPPTIYWNQYQSATASLSCVYGNIVCGVLIRFFIPAHKISSIISVSDANQQARDKVNAKKQQAEAFGDCGGLPCNSLVSVEVDPTGDDVGIDL